jgi:peptidoglycan/xylan/chitin deacetylase (PgdA/CDA1 family)
MPGYLGKPEIRSLTDAGMSIGSHGYSHVDWRGLDDAGAQREFVDARNVLADVVGKPVDEAALPFGRFDRHVLSRLKALGYTRVFTSARGTTSAKSWFCPRTSITRDFVAKRDLPALCTAHARFKGWLLSHARRIRYGH